MTLTCPQLFLTELVPSLSRFSENLPGLTSKPFLKSSSFTSKLLRPEKLRSGQGREGTGPPLPSLTFMGRPPGNTARLPQRHPLRPGSRRPCLMAKSFSCEAAKLGEKHIAGCGGDELFFPNQFCFRAELTCSPFTPRCLMRYLKRSSWLPFDTSRGIANVTAVILTCRASA